MRRRSIAICGNGASAAVLLCALARNGESQLDVTVIGSGEVPGQGVAYATTNDNHLLNVPAGRMSADPLQPSQFLDWLGMRGIHNQTFAGQFVARSFYGRYLEDHLDIWLKAAPQLAVQFRQARVRAISRHGNSWLVSHDGGTVEADLVVLATGNDMPAPMAAGYDPAIAGRIIDMPWGKFDVGPKENILVLGTGLTAIDAVITLLDQGHQGAITLLSRRALLPARHVESANVPGLKAPYPKTVVGLLRALRGAAGRDPAPANWQGLMDAMRPLWPLIWSGMPPVEKKRFLRHAATHWSVHRHRMAPQVAERMDQAPIHIVKGRLHRLTSIGQALRAEIVQGGAMRSMHVDFVINCTGPNSDPQKNPDPLIQELLASGHARAGANRLSLDVDEANRLRNSDGMVHPGLFAMGALTRDRWWEITAIPEIARQAIEIASHVRAYLSVLDASSRAAERSML